MNYRSQDLAKAIVLEANEAYFNAERRRQNHGGPRVEKISREILFWEALP